MREPIGRRQALRTLGALGVSLALPARAAPRLDCVAVPELTEGPFFVDEKLERSDLTGGAAGWPLRLQIAVLRAGDRSCAPLPGAQVDLWHANAAGVYSDEPAGELQDVDTRGQTWLRGYQRTDSDGMAQFDTIYPGWYPGRTVHIHFKVRTGKLEFTSQLFFDDALSDSILGDTPYAGRGARKVRNADDWIYRHARAQSLVLKPEHTAQGLVAQLRLGLHDF
jgi:protocatechuate 3,4-dioxygenase beta subunit